MNKSLDSKKNGGRFCCLLAISKTFKQNVLTTKEICTLGLRAGSFYMACMNLMALRFLYICRFYSDREISVTLVSVKKNHLRDGMGCYFNQDQSYRTTIKK